MSRDRSKTHNASRTPRPRRRIHEETDAKLPEIAGCPRCGISYRNGRWTWQKPPVGSYAHVCPACERIEGGYPAGLLHVSGEFAAKHHDEIVTLLRNIEERESAEHPLKRIMSIAELEDDAFEVTTTDAKLVETFGRALEHAYAGKLDHPPTHRDPTNLLRVRWSRD